MKRLVLLLLSTVLFTLPLLVPNWHNKLVVITMIFWLLSKPNFRDLAKVKYWILGILLMVYVSLNIVSMFYSRNIVYAISHLETILPLVAFYVIVFSYSATLTSSNLNSLLTAFVVGVVSLNIASLAFISHDLWDPQNLQANLILANNAIVKIHPAFLSMYISFSILYIADQYFPLSKDNRTKLGWIFFALTTLSVFLIWLNSRPGILGFLLATFFFVIRKYVGRVRRYALMFWFAVIIAIVLMPFSRARFLSAPIAVWKGTAMQSESVNTNLSPLFVRQQILATSFELLHGPELFFGFGSGDGKDALRSAYLRNGQHELVQGDMDAHNEYLAEVHRHGLVGLLILVAVLSYVFRIGILENSPLLGAFVILFSITALFENVFSAQKAASFFAIISSLLILRAQRSRDH